MTDDDMKQLFNIRVHEGHWNGIGFDEAVAKIEALIAVRYITFDVTFGERVSVTPPPPQIKTEYRTETIKVYICPVKGCTHREWSSIQSLRGHIGRVHKIIPIKVTP